MVCYQTPSGFLTSVIALGSLSGVSATYIKSSGTAEDWKLGDISLVCCTTLASYFNLLNFHFHFCPSSVDFALKRMKSGTEIAPFCAYKQHEAQQEWHFLEYIDVNVV